MMRRAMTTGVLAEWEDAPQMCAALRKLRDLGYAELETYTPFDVAEVDVILRRPRSRLPLAILAAGIGGAAGAYALQWLTNAYWYPLRVGGRPPHFPLAYVPITFEMGVLAASAMAFAGVILLGPRVRLWTPESEAEDFESSTNDGFWIAIDDRDPRCERSQTTRTLRELGARRVSSFGDAPERDAR